MNKIKLLDVSTFEEEVFKKITTGVFDLNRYDLIRAGKDASEDDILELVKNVEIVLSDPLHVQPVTRRIIDTAENLKLIQCYSIGFDDIDIKAAREKNIPVANTAGTLSKPIAEYTIAVTLYLLKSIEFARSELNKGNWVQQQMLSPPELPLEFGVLTLGIYGCGAIGQEVARLAKGFGTRIIYHNRNKLPEKVEQELGLEYSSFDDLISSSDVLSISVPLTDETRGKIGREEIFKMKAGAVLVNTARGAIVDYGALADAVKSGYLRGAAVDVFENEPDIWECPLFDLRNVVLTPHISNASPESPRRCMEKVTENLRRFYEGKPLLNIVN